MMGLQLVQVESRPWCHRWPRGALHALQRLGPRGPCRRRRPGSPALVRSMEQLIAGRSRGELCASQQVALTTRDRRTSMHNRAAAPDHGGRAEWDILLTSPKNNGKPDKKRRGRASVPNRPVRRCGCSHPRTPPADVAQRLLPPSSSHRRPGSPGPRLDVVGRGPLIPISFELRSRDDGVGADHAPLVTS